MERFKKTLYKEAKEIAIEALMEEYSKGIMSHFMFDQVMETQKELLEETPLLELIEDARPLIEYDAKNGEEFSRRCSQEWLDTFDEIIDECTPVKQKIDKEFKKEYTDTQYSMPFTEADLKKYMELGFKLALKEIKKAEKGYAINGVVQGAILVDDIKNLEIE